MTDINKQIEFLLENLDEVDKLLEKIHSNENIDIDINSDKLKNEISNLKSDDNLNIIYRKVAEYFSAVKDIIMEVDSSYKDELNKFKTIADTTKNITDNDVFSTLYNYDENLRKKVINLQANSSDINDLTHTLRFTTQARNKSGIIEDNIFTLIKQLTGKPIDIDKLDTENEDISYWLKEYANLNDSINETNESITNEQQKIKSLSDYYDRLRKVILEISNTKTDDFLDRISYANMEIAFGGSDLPERIKDALYGSNEITDGEFAQNEVNDILNNTIKNNERIIEDQERYNKILDDTKNRIDNIKNEIQDILSITDKLNADEQSIAIFNARNKNIGDIGTAELAKKYINSDTISEELKNQLQDKLNAYISKLSRKSSINIEDEAYNEYSKQIVQIKKKEEEEEKYLNREKEKYIENLIKQVKLENTILKLKEITGNTKTNDEIASEKGELSDYIHLYRQVASEVKKYQNIANRHNFDIPNIDTSNAGIYETATIKKYNLEQLKQRIRSEEAYVKEIESTKRAEAKATNEVKTRANEVYNKVTSVLSKITNAVKRTLSNIVSIVRKLNNLVNSSIRFMISGFNRLASGVRKILTLFGNFGNRVRNINRNGNILKGTFTELKSKIDLLVGAFRTLANNEFLQNGTKLLSSVQSLNMLIGKDLTANTIEWANNLEKSFGLSASGLITNLQSVSAVLYGMGMSSNNVYNASRNLEALGMTMSSITGLDFDTVITKIDSGMKGMTQSIDDLGLSVRESQMDAFLQKLKAQGGEYANIGTKFQNLTEEQRVYVRYAAIMDQFMSKSAFSAESYAKSLNTLTGQISIFKQQVQQLKATIGTLFLKLVAQIIQPLTYIVYLANQAVKRIAAMFGIDLELKNTINELGGGGIDTSGVDGLTDSLNDAKEAAEEATGGLSQLDHITSLNSNKNKSNGADVFDYSKLADYNANYADMLEELGKMNDDYIEQCRQALKQMLKDMEKRVGDWFKRLTGRVIDWDVVEKNFGRSWKNIKDTGKNLKEIFKNVFDIVGGLLGSVLDDLDFSTLFEKFTRLISYLTKLGAIITKRLQPYIQKFYDDYLSPYVVKFGDWLEEHLDKWIHKTEEWLGGWESHKYDNDLKNFFENTLPEKFNKFVESVQNAKDRITELKNFIKGGDNDKTFIDVIKEKFEFLRDNVIKPIQDILHDLKIKLFDKNDDGQVNLEDAKISLGEIKDKIKEVGDYLTEHKDDIVKLLTTAVNFIVELGKAKLKVFEEIFKFVVEHSDLIQAICKAVIDLINFVIEHPLLSLDIAIKASLLGEAIKIGGQVAARKLIEKLLFGGTTSKAVGEAVGKELGGGILSKIRTITATDWVAVLPIAGIVALIVAEANAAVKGTKDVVSNYKQAKKAQDYGFDLHKLKMQAYEMKQVLDKAYGDANDKFSEEHKSLVIETYANDLRKSGQFTEEQIQYYTDTMTKWLDTFTDNKHKWLEAMTYSSSSDDTVDRVNRIANAVVDYEMTVKDTSNSVANSVENAANSINNSTNEISSSLNNADTSSIKSDFVELGTQMKQIMTEIRNMISIIMNEITAKFRNMSYSAAASLNSMRMATNQLLSQITNVQYRLRDTQNNAINWNTKVPGLGSGIKVTKARGFANGGIPQSGSLFFANENGNPELVANFGGYTGVANKETIAEALKGAIGTSNNNSQTVNVTNNFNIGYMMGDDASLAKITRAITAKQKQLNYNVANNNFAMS